ncbi:hypothetical protein LIER_29476 [Lithospermum erythrorhizon]|uniref:Uncharacterized protein n=1 Tax=Lithospermum erythrorhizon TaxID=34254 RepID=A0AAV3RMU6_LITER
MGGLVSKNAVATANKVTETAPFDHIANTNDCSKINTNDADAISDPGKTNKNEEGNSPRAVTDDFNVVKENENKASEEHHSGTDVKETIQVGEKIENANQALEDHHPGMINKENIRTGIKYNGKEIKSSIKRTRRKEQKMVVVVEDVKDADEDVAEKKKASVELKIDKEEETPNAEDIVVEDVKEDQKKKRKITRKMDTRKTKRKRRTL